MARLPVLNQLYQKAIELKAYTFQPTGSSYADYGNSADLYLWSYIKVTQIDKFISYF